MQAKGRIINMQAIVKFNQVTFQPGDTALLKDISFSIYANEMIRVEGPSGSGKSTLLRLIAALIPRNSGEINYLDQPLEEVAYQTYRQNISSVSETSLLLGETLHVNFIVVYY